MVRIGLGIAVTSLAVLASFGCGGSGKPPTASGVAGVTGAAGATAGRGGVSGSAGAAGTGGAAGMAGTGGAAGAASTAGAGGAAGIAGAGAGSTAGSAGAASTAGISGSGGAAGTATGGAAAGRGGTGGGAGTGGGGAAGTAAAAGRGGGAGTAGAGGRGGGTGGQGGTAGSAGASGTAGASGCTITATSSLSTAIPMVGIVRFTTNLTEITRAEIRFGLASSGPTLTAPVDLIEPGYRTLLLGMKASTAYVFRIVLTSGAGTCTSQDYPIMTGAAPVTVRSLTTTIMNPAKHAKGFIILGNASGLAAVYIVDAADGQPVWGAMGRGLPSRAHMGWDGRDMYQVAQNASNVLGQGWSRRISMDGTDVENDLSGIVSAHHDFTVIPGGIAMLLWSATGSTNNSLVERMRDGTVTTVVPDLGALYDVSGSANLFHPNSIHYHQWDDSYTISDTYPRLYVKISRKGALLWQFGGSNPKDPSKHFQVTWSGENHGHHLLADGTFLFFNNLQTARVFKLDETSMTATSVLAYAASGLSSGALGDVQRLPNGNILVTYSVNGVIHEIDPSGQLVATYRVDGQFGYAEFRETLYGPPPY